MTRAHTWYVATEAAVGAVINAVLSAAFGLFVFGSMGRVPFAGAGGLVTDAVPQSFMVVLMSVLVPTVLTRRRLSAGAVAGLPASRLARLPRHPLARALAAALAAAGLGALLWALPLAFGVAGLPFAPMLAGKIAYGATLGAAVAAASARIALGDAH